MWKTSSVATPRLCTAMVAIERIALVALCVCGSAFACSDQDGDRRAVAQRFDGSQAVSIDAGVPDAAAAPDAAKPEAASPLRARWRVVGRVKTSSMPWSVSATETSLYVAHVGRKDRDNVWRYDAETLEVVARSRFPGHGVETSLTRDRASLYVTNSRKHELLELDPEDLSVRRRLPTGKTPKHFVLSRDESTAYTANWSSGDVTATELSSAEQTWRVRTGRHARGVAIAPDGDVYVANFGAGDVVAIDTERRTVAARARACTNPRHIVVVGDRLLVTCFGAGKLAVFDRTSLERTHLVDVGRGPKTIAVSPERSLAVTADERGNSITFVDLATLSTETMQLSARKPCGIAFSPTGDVIYVTARGSHELLKLSRD